MSPPTKVDIVRLTDLIIKYTDQLCDSNGRRVPSSSSVYAEVAKEYYGNPIVSKADKYRVFTYISSN